MCGLVLPADMAFDIGNANLRPTERTLDCSDEFAAGHFSSEFSQCRLHNASLGRGWICPVRY